MARIAFLSTAHIHTRGFLEHFREHTDGRCVAAIWDDEAERGRCHAATAGAPFVAKLDDVLADPAVGGFAICAENNRHLALLKRVIPLGKPVFCDKPLVTTLADARTLARLLRKYPDTPVVSGFFHTFSAELRGVAAVLERGELGTVTRMRFRNSHQAALARWFDAPELQWFVDPALSGGGALLDMGSHAIHALRTFGGPVRRVWATLSNHSGVYPAVEDAGMAVLEFATGAIGVVEASWSQTGGINGVEIQGTARALWNTPQGYVVGGPGEVPRPLPHRMEEPGRMGRLVALVRGEIPADTWRADLAVSLDTTAILSAAYASAASGTWEPVGALLDTVGR